MNIQAIKVGTTVNISINGKFHKKNCSSMDEANELFKLALLAKENPSNDNLKAVRLFLNEKTRVALMIGLDSVEANPDTGEVYLAGFNTPIPFVLVDIIKDYHKNGFPLTSILNFWSLLMVNLDTRIRENLFDFIVKHDFVLTDNGYMVVYKAVAYQNKVDNDLAEFVSNQYLKVKKDWKCSPNKYTVYQDSDNNYGMTKNETIGGWDLDDKNIIIVGRLGELNAELDKIEVKSVYTDKHTKTMSIQLGVPVRMKRNDCDGDPAVECSVGLHVGSTKYVESFGGEGDAVLVCLVNPAHVVAIPNYDRSKMRVSEYFPFALATYENKKIDIIEEKYFESDYMTYEKTELAEMIAKLKQEELPIQPALNAEEEVRPMSELLKMLEHRLIDL
jgi:hypothetical protein